MNTTTDTTLREAVAQAIMDADPSPCECPEWPGCDHQYAVDASAAIATIRDYLVASAHGTYAVKFGALRVYLPDWIAEHLTPDAPVLPPFTDEHVERLARVIYDDLPNDPFEKIMESDGFERPWAWSWDYARQHAPNDRRIKAVWDKANKHLAAAFGVEGDGE